MRLPKTNCVQRDFSPLEMVHALTLLGWTVEKRALYDEEAVEGWTWTDSRGREYSEVGDWDQMPPWPASARRAYLDQIMHRANPAME